MADGALTDMQIEVLLLYAGRPNWDRRIPAHGHARCR
jgi:hypothetical protein